MPRILRTTPLLFALLLPCTSALAQSEAPQKTTCKVDTAAPSEADLAFFRRDLKKAETLYAAALANNPADSRAREHHIDSLIGQHRLDDARKLLADWASSDPDDSYALAAAADVRFAEGDWLDSYALNLKALEFDPCNPDAFAGSADYESLAGFRATAHKHYAIAHQIEPSQVQFYLDWAEGLPVSEQMDAAKLLIDQGKYFDEKQRAAMEKTFEKLRVSGEHRCELASSSGPAVIPMVPIYNYGSASVSGYGIEVAFNRHKRVLELNSGASGFLLTHSSGANAGMATIAKTVTGPGSNADYDTELDRADSVRIGGLEFRDCPVTVYENFRVMGGSYLEGHPLDDKNGIVGLDIFNRYLITLDYIKHEVRLDPLPQPPGTSGTDLDPLGGNKDPDWIRQDRYVAPAMQGWTNIYVRGSALVLPTRINSDKTKLFIMTNGAYANFVNSDTAIEITKDPKNIRQIQNLTTAGKMSLVGGFTADFAGVRLYVKSMDVMPTNYLGEGISGVLGSPTLEQLVMHIDYRDNLVLFEAPTAKHL